MRKKEIPDSVKTAGENIRRIIKEDYARMATSKQSPVPFFYKTILRHFFFDFSSLMISSNSVLSIPAIKIVTGNLGFSVSRIFSICLVVILIFFITPPLLNWNRNTSPHFPDHPWLYRTDLLYICHTLWHQPCHIQSTFQYPALPGIAVACSRCKSQSGCDSLCGY